MELQPVRISCMTELGMERFDFDRTPTRPTVEG